MKTTTIVTLLLLPLFGCITNQSDESPQFGEPYDLVQTSTLPSLAGDSVFVRVAYSGCSGNHSFVLAYRVVSLTAEIWLVKETSDQHCDAYFEETRSFLLPTDGR